MAESTFAEHFAQENAKEQAAARGEVSESAPVSSSAPEPPAAAELLTPEPIDRQPDPEPEPEPTVEAEPKADAERNTDGTFKKRSAKAEAKADDVPRIRELTAKWRQAERERDELRAQLAAPPTTPATTPSAMPAPTSLDPSDPEPTLQQFIDAGEVDPYAALAVAAAKWAVREGYRVQAAQFAQQQAAEASAQTAERIVAFAQTHPDYQEKIEGISDIQFSREVLETIANDEQAAAVAYHLASYPEEARRIAALRPLEGAKAVGQLIARLTPAPSGSGVPAVSVSKAKPLIKPVSASPSVPDTSPPDPEQTKLADWIRIGNAEERRAREVRRGV